MNGQWTAENPGAGSPADMRAAAARRAWDATRTREAAVSLQVPAGEVWEGAAATAVRERAGTVRAELGVLAGQAEWDARVMSVYAGEVEAIARAHASIRQAQARLTVELRLAQVALAAASGISAIDPSPAARARARVEALTTEGEQWRSRLGDLGEQRRRADRIAIFGWGSPTSRGGLAGAGSAGRYAGDLEGLVELTEGELATLFALHPEVRERLLAEASAPGHVAQWWRSLTAEQQDALVLGAPGLMGALGGLPVMVRVAANRMLAHRELDEVRRQRRDLAGPGSTFREPEFLSPKEKTGLWGVTSDAIALLDKKEAYLKKVVAGTVQLYLYQPEQDRIVEMVGTLGPDTAHVVTYVPGTSSNQRSFYDYAVQKVAGWMDSKAEGIVTFVWHGGGFPGQVPGTDMLEAMAAANKGPLATSTGKELSGFAAELDADPRLAGLHRQAVAHSWGLAAVTASEVAGAHYENVASLAGAWMPKDWQPHPDTDYVHYTYTDFLTVAKRAGGVGGDVIPEKSDAFAAPLGALIPAEGDFTFVIPRWNDPDHPIRIPWNKDLAATHDLIASDDPANWRVLNNVVQEFRR